MRKNQYPKSCQNCGKEFMVTPSSDKRYNRLHCSIACKKDAALKRGNPTHYNVNAWKVHTRKCVDCGYDQHPELIIIHHVDGNRQNGQITNLVPLCQNCHAWRHIEMAKENPYKSRKAVPLGGPSARHSQVYAERIQ
jgi:5-methylcytosine-specific restriction endonuclease McrA